MARWESALVTVILALSVAACTSDGEPGPALTAAAPPTSLGVASTTQVSDAPALRPEPTPRPEAVSGPALDYPIAVAVAPPWPAIAHGELHPGDQASAVASLQDHLRQLHFQPGSATGLYDEATEGAVWALQKLGGLEPTGVVDDATWELLREPPLLTPATAAEGGGNRAEVDLVRQVLTVWSPTDDLLLVTHVSTGSGEYFCIPGSSRCGHARTRPGDFTIYKRIDGWRHAPLGALYNPLYFNGGIAIHGSQFVPTWPDSHGCVRVPMQVAELLPTMLGIGDRVHVLDGETA